MRRRQRDDLVTGPEAPPEMPPEQTGGAEIRRILASSRPPGVEPSPSADPSRPGGFYEWSLKRLERRQRRLVMAMGALAALLAVALYADFDGGSSAGETRDPRVEALTRDLTVLRDDLARGLERVAAAAERDRALRRQIRSLTKCTSQRIDVLRDRIRLVLAGRRELRGPRSRIAACD